MRADSTRRMRAASRGKARYAAHSALTDHPGTFQMRGTGTVQACTMKTEAQNPSSVKCADLRSDTSHGASAATAASVSSSAAR